jgi:hypothetical protein
MTRSLVEQAKIRLRVGAIEDLTQDEIDALLKHIDQVETMLDNILEDLPVDYDDMYPEED